MARGRPHNLGMVGQRTTFELLTLIDQNLGCWNMVAPAELTGSVFRHSDEMWALSCKDVLEGELRVLWLSPTGTFHTLLGKFSYFVFFVITFTYFVIRFLLYSSIVKSDNEIGKVMTKRYDLKIR